MMEKRINSRNSSPPTPDKNFVWIAVALSLAWCLLSALYFHFRLMTYDDGLKESETVFFLLATIAPLLLIWSTVFVMVWLRELSINARLLSEAAWRLNHPDQAFVDQARSVSEETRKHILSLDQTLRDMASSLEQVRGSIVAGSQGLQKSLDKARQESATLSLSLSEEWQNLSAMLDSLCAQSESLRASSDEMGVSLREATSNLTRVLEQSLARLSAHLEDSREQIGILISAQAEQEASLNRQASASLVELEEKARLAVTILEEASESTAHRLEQTLATLPETLKHTRELFHEIDTKALRWNASERPDATP